MEIADVIEEVPIVCWCGRRAHYVYPNGDEVSNVEIVYICRDYRGEIRPQQEEIEEIRYFSVEEIQMEEISPPIRPVLQKYKKTFERGILKG